MPPRRNNNERVRGLDADNTTLQKRVTDKVIHIQLLGRELVQIAGELLVRDTRDNARAEIKNVSQASVIAGQLLQDTCQEVLDKIKIARDTASKNNAKGNNDGKSN